MKGLLLLGILGGIAVACFGIGHGNAPPRAQGGEKPRAQLELYVRPGAPLESERCVRPARSSRTLKDRTGRTWLLLEGGIFCGVDARGAAAGQWILSTNRLATHRIRIAGGFLYLSRLVPPFTSTGPASESQSAVGRNCQATELSAASLSDSFAESETPLAPCQSYRSGDILLTTRIASTPPRQTPYLQFRNHRAAAGGKLLVYLPGGPFVPALAGLGRNEILKSLLIDEPAVSTVIVPVYAGASYTYLEGIGNFDVALSQTSSMLDQLKEAHPEQQLCVIGGSLGGRLAGHLAVRHPDTRFLLLNPLIWSARELNDSAARSDPGYLTRSYSLRQVGPSDESVPDPQFSPILKSAALSGYFGRHYSRTLLSVLEEGVRNVDVVYAGSDEKIGVNLARELRTRLGPGRVIEVKEVGHEVGEMDSFWAIEEHLKNFVRACGRPVPRLHS